MQQRYPAGNKPGMLRLNGMHLKPVAQGDNISIPNPPYKARVGSVFLQMEKQPSTSSTPVLFE